MLKHCLFEQQVHTVLLENILSNITEREPGLVQDIFSKINTSANIQ